MLKRHQILQGDIVHHLIDGFVDAAVDLHRDALALPLAEFRAGLQTGYRRQAALDGTEDEPDGVFLRRAVELISALGAAACPKIAALDQRRHDLLQIFDGDILPFRDGFQGDAVLLRMQGDVQHHSQGVTAAGGKFQIGSLPQVLFLIYDRNSRKSSVNLMPGPQTG